jgi:membrane-bound metal-dependent hydrolase YbcI (DUF457 family)
MDPISHAVIGHAVASALRPGAARARGVAAASILGALSPDVDFVLMPVGWDVYLRAHVIGTHAIAGAVLTGLGSALLVRLCVRRSAFAALSAAAVLAAISHLFADIVSGARLRPGWPFNEAIVSAPLVAMGDPWTIAVLIACAALLWRWRAAPSRAARTALIVFGLFLAVKGALLAQVLGGPASAPDIDRESRILEARWGSLTEWYVFDRGAGALRQWRARVGSRPPDLMMTIAGRPEPPLVRRSRSLPSVRNFLAVHELGFAREETRGGGRDVMWSDIRYCRRDASPAVQCALWFGGIYDAAGRPTMQEVRVGSWTQHRPS